MIPPLFFFRISSDFSVFTRNLLYFCTVFTIETILIFTTDYFTNTYNNFYRNAKFKKGFFDPE